MHEHLPSLQEVYTQSIPHMREILEESEHTEDFIRGMRYMMRMQPESSAIVIEGYTQLLDHLHLVQNLANSYHTAIGTMLRQEQQEVPPYYATE